MILKTEPQTNERLDLWVVLLRAVNAVMVHDRESIVRNGLTPGEFSVLEILYSKGPMLLGEIRKKALTSSGGTTYLVDKLQGKGLVERRLCETDRRATFAALTPAGQQLMARVFPEHARAMERALGGLTAEEAVVARALIRKLGLYAAELPVGETGRDGTGTEADGEVGIAAGTEAGIE